MDANSAIVEKELTSELVVIPIVSPSSSYGGACNTNFDIFGAKLMQYTVLYDWIVSKLVPVVWIKVSFETKFSISLI